MAELDDYHAIYELISHILMFNKHSNKMFEKVLVYLGKHGVYESYKKIAINCDDFKTFNMIKYMKPNKRKQKHYYIKTIKTIDSSSSYSTFEKYSLIIEINHRIISSKLANKSLYKNNKKMANEMYNICNYRNLLTLVKYYLNSNIDGTHNFDMASKVLDKMKNNIDDFEDDSNYQYYRKICTNREFDYPDFLIKN